MLTDPSKEKIENPQGKGISTLAERAQRYAEKVTLLQGTGYKETPTEAFLAYFNATCDAKRNQLNEKAEKELQKITANLKKN